MPQWSRGGLQQGFSHGLVAAYVVTGVRRGFFIPVAPVVDLGYSFQPRPLPLGVHVGQFIPVGYHPALSALQPSMALVDLLMVTMFHS